MNDKMTEISFLVNNQKLTGHILYPETLKEKNPAVLFIHGWASSESGYILRAEVLVKLGYICMIFNLRGHGASNGKLEDFSRKDHLEDVIAAYDYLASKSEVDQDNISVLGASYGGYLASILSSKRKVKNLILRAPALYKDDDFTVPTASLKRKNIQVYRQSSLPSEDNMALKGVSTFTGNILLIESENDTIVPHQTLENYREVIKNKSLLTDKILQGVDHNLSNPESKQAFIELLVSYFQSKLTP